MPKRTRTYDDAKFVSSGDIQCTYAIHEKTLRHVRFQGDQGKRLYDVAHLRELLGEDAIETPAKQLKRIIYARVSSAHQQDDLARQQSDLQKAYPNHELVSDTGSGLNFKRKGFKTLLDAVVDGLVEEVVVMHRDRLCRFGADLLDSIFAKTGTKLVVHCSPDGPEDDSRELADDLLAVTTVFVARHNGRRSADNRRRRSREARQTQKAASHACKEVSRVPDSRTAANDQDLDGGCPVDIQSNRHAPQFA